MSEPNPDALPTYQTAYTKDIVPRYGISTVGHCTLVTPLSYSCGWAPSLDVRSLQEGADEPLIMNG
jgi:hypothetical protein